MGHRLARPPAHSRRRHTWPSWGADAEPRPPRPPLASARGRSSRGTRLSGRDLGSGACLAQRCVFQVFAASPGSMCRHTTCTEVQASPQTPAGSHGRCGQPTPYELCDSGCCPNISVPYSKELLLCAGHVPHAGGSRVGRANTCPLVLVPQQRQRVGTDPTKSGSSQCVHRRRGLWKAKRRQCVGWSVGLGCCRLTQHGQGLWTGPCLSKALGALLASGPECSGRGSG